MVKPGLVNLDYKNSKYLTNPQDIICIYYTKNIMFILPGQ